MSDQQTFAVARIMKHRTTTTGQVEYYVRWKDENNESEMTPDTDTWEPTSSFVDGEKSSAILEYWARQPKTKNILPAATIMMQPGQMVQPGQPAGQFLLQPVGTAGTGIVQQQILSPVHGQTVQSGQIIHQASQFQGQVQVQGQAQVQGQPKIIQQVQQPMGPQSQVLFLQSPTQPGRIIQQQPLNIQMGHQGPIQYILSPSHAVSSPMTSPIPLNQTYPSQITITHSPHTPSVIKQNNFGVIKTSPVQLSPSTQPTRTPRRTSESSNLVKTEQLESPKKQPTNMDNSEQTENSIKSPSYNPAANDLSMLADAAMEYMNNETQRTATTKTEKQDEPPPLVMKTDPVHQAPAPANIPLSNTIKSERAVSPPPLTTTQAPPVQKETVTKGQKRRGRPPGLTKAKLAERKKAREAEAASAPVPAAKKQKRGRGRPPKTAAEQTKELVLQKAKELDSSDSSDSDSNTSSDQSVSDDNSSDSSDDNKQPKIKPSGVSMIGKKKVPVPLKSPPGKAKIRKNSTASNSDLKSPEKIRRDSIVSDKRRESISSNLSNFDDSSVVSKPRRDSISKSGPNSKRSAIPTQIKTKEVTKIDDLKWAIKTIKKQEFITYIKTNEKPQTIGHTPGQLMAEMDHATSKHDIGLLTRKLVGCSFIKDDGSVYIPDEINGKKNESVLVKAAQKSAADGGPALINALCGVGGADPNQKSAKENTAIHEAAQAGQPGNVSALIGYHSQINWKNSEDKTALHLAVSLAKKWEKFSKAETQNQEFKENCDNSYACVELLLAAGADPTREILEEAEFSEVADILNWYDITLRNEVYNFIKRSMGKISLDVPDKLVASLNCVPSDQNMVELVLPELENFPPNVFLILFAVHGEHGGFGMDFNRLNNLRLSGNPCLIEEVIWHKPRIAKQKEEFTSLDGLQSVARLGPYEPGKTVEQYKLDTFDTHFITVLEYVPFRKNKYTISMMPAHWSTEKVFLRVYPCQLTIASATLQKTNPEILRLMNKYTDEFRSINKKVDIARKQWQTEMKKECEILKKGIECPGQKKPSL